MSSIRQLVVLAGGKGTRLGEHARNTPKPLMQIDETRVFLDYLLENAARQGFADILLLAGHLGKQISERYHNTKVGGSDITVLIEPEPRGTGGALTFAEPHLAGAFVVLNGDTYFDVNLRALTAVLEAHKDIDAALALRRVDNASRYGAVLQDEAGFITRFKEKDAARGDAPGVINGGIYAMRRRALARLTKSPASIESDLFPAVVAERKLWGSVCDGYFIDIGLPETLNDARRDFAHRRRPVLFLDRDGVLNEDVHYLHQLSDWRWIDGAPDAIRMANDAGVAVVVVTNQSGVARGKYREREVLALHAAIQEDLHARGAFIDAFQYCPYHVDADSEVYQIAEPIDRKPSPNLFFRAARQLRLDLALSLFVGDQESDQAAAQNADLPFIRYASGHLGQLIASTPHWRRLRSPRDKQMDG